jgi:endonuclease/exonuclease/phosphatase family metal-dependent hydrolase
VTGVQTCALPISEYQQLLAPDENIALPLVDAWRYKHPDIARAPTAGLHGFKWPERADCFDFFFVTADLLSRLTEVEVQSETAASDHQPIVLDLA